MSAANHKLGPVSLELSEHGNACLSGATPEARFHIWLDNNTLLPVDGVVFKNTLGADRMARTIRLDMRRGGGKQIADAMLPQVHALYAGAKEALDREIAQKWAAQDAAIAQNLAEKAGPVLLVALRRLAAADMALTKAVAGPARDIGAELQELGEAQRQARAAIAKATARDNVLKGP